MSKILRLFIILHICSYMARTQNSFEKLNSLSEKFKETAYYDELRPGLDITMTID
jgi:hypothetical protein